MSYDVTKLRVLIVDDDPYLRQMLRAILQSFGVAEMAEAADGDSGLDELRRFEPNIVFVDWGMAPMNGVEMMRKIRHMDTDRHRFVPIIMMSGHTEKHRVLEARDAGATEFLAKPLSTKAVLARLVAVIEKPRDFVRTKNFFGPDRRRRTWGAYTGGERRQKGDGAMAASASPSPAAGLESDDLVLRPIAERAQDHVGGD
jgi:DNA-binding response OmpR family regulator